GVKPEMRLLVADSADTAASPVSDLTDRDALIMFTSGTTGMPKMVPWTHDNVAASIEGISGAYQLGAGDAVVSRSRADRHAVGDTGHRRRVGIASPREVLGTHLRR